MAQGSGGNLLVWQALGLIGVAGALIGVNVKRREKSSETRDTTAD